MRDQRFGGGAVFFGRLGDNQSRFILKKSAEYDRISLSIAAWGAVTGKVKVGCGRRDGLL